MLSKVKKLMVQAMKDKNKEVVGYYRLMVAELQKVEKESKQELDEKGGLKVLQSYKKKNCVELFNYYYI